MELEKVQRRTTRSAGCMFNLMISYGRFSSVSSNLDQLSWPTPPSTRRKIAIYLDYTYITQSVISPIIPP